MDVQEKITRAIVEVETLKKMLSHTPSELPDEVQQVLLREITQMNAILRVIFDAVKRMTAT